MAQGSFNATYAILFAVAVVLVVAAIWYWRSSEAESYTPGHVVARSAGHEDHLADVHLDAARTRLRAGGTASGPFDPLSRIQHGGACGGCACGNISPQDPRPAPNKSDPQPAAGRSAAMAPLSDSLADGAPSYEAILQSEQNAWSQAGSGAVFNPENGDAGDQMAAQHAPRDELNYSEQLSKLAVPAKAHKSHKEWADETGPYTQTAMIVDDMDEAQAMSSVPRMGITSFSRGKAPPVSANAYQITENDSHTHGRHFRKRSLI